MKSYLVGGAVRDRLLGYPYKEKDWVVVGATPDDLIKRGFKQVGRDFPVFLHPTTHEEYALARTERKEGKGYYGFRCDFNPSVTLNEDLKRRDLTINAMAMNDAGELIDPYHGADDLKAKVLRHVSPAFIEDPVRVLRVARFAARYHHLGFVLAEDTRQLMYTMVRQGELAHLVPERVWQEWQRSLEEPHPEVFINTLRSCDALRVVLPEIHALFGVPNSQHYHREIDSGIHTLMVIQQAVSLSKDPLIRFAATVHDLGKAITPMSQWPKHAGHDHAGKNVIESLCQRLRIPTEYRNVAVLASTMHLMIHRLAELDASSVVKILEACDAFRRPQLFEQLLQTCEADAQGRLGAGAYPQASQWLALQQACSLITPKTLLEQGVRGEAIRQGLHELRVEHVKHWKKHEKK